MERRGRGRGPASPAFPSSPYTRKLSGPHARMSDAWVLGLVPTLLLGLLAGLQQVGECLGGKSVEVSGPDPGGSGACFWSGVTPFQC